MASSFNSSMSYPSAIFPKLAPALALALALVCGVAEAEQIPVSPQGRHGNQPATIAPVRVALLFELETAEPSLEEVTRKASAVLGALLSALPRLHVIDPDEYGEVSGSGSRSDVPERLAHTTGAGLLLSGRVFSSNRDLFIMVRVAGAETGRSFGEVVKVLPTEAPTVAVEQLASKVARLIEARADELFESQLSSQEIRTLISKLPNPPALRLTELADSPGPETEILAEVLRESGFDVVEGGDPGTALNAGGHIYVSDGPRKDELYSASARIELALSERRSGDVALSEEASEMIFASDRESARRAAVTSAAREIATRILPAFER